MPILVLDDILTVDFCNHMIDWFESNPDKYDGFVGGHDTFGSFRKIDHKIKKSIDADIKSPDDKHVLHNAYGNCMRQYRNYCDYLPVHNMYPSPFRVRRYNEGDYYNWHTDYEINNRGVRTATILHYLNDTIGGETEFTDGTIVEPKVGRSLIFPAHWTVPHRGKTPTEGSKYIITCFVYNKLK
tara:strand:- start:80 stop:631 length:552 start_codon:yes stop_codon:yes gene_type:complete